MIHRKDGIDQINLQGTNLGIRLEAFSLSLNKAKYVTKINLKDCGLTNQEGISVITNINRGLVRELNLSGNSTLTQEFYQELDEYL